ncbi:helix-turn-helix domain-containing protein [Tamlana fucoidanivorans]|uniref:Helix-turn-helix domain-containing protein n=1 Tax=Allotamlana fucoidanivorans TaxID=2583814 RepID=A0A5C4SCP8_9FLAO|nr:helix-turn-helix domain-containing protein [Tamlana fucoidanivorans]TNJ41347.1 helix-turn-helix domain-containing protein [Tamlana fucoidanivorans]
MKKQILQIENVESSEFIPKILSGFKNLLKEQNKSSQDAEILLTREETSKMLSISLVTLWKYTREGILPAFRIGTKVRYKKSDILQALKQMNKF